MNAVNILRNGHKTVLEAVEGLAPAHWQTPGAGGQWTVKDLIAHLTSFEWMLVELLDDLLHEGTPTPLLARFRQDPAAFNDAEAAKRRDDSAAEVMAEYKNAHEEALALAERIPAAVWNQQGIFPWYGDAYDLEDFIVYTIYGHKREHCAQIAAFRHRREE